MAQTKSTNRIKSLGAGSAKYGSCEVCCAHVSETFLRTVGSTQVWGHETCVRSLDASQMLRTETASLARSAGVAQ